MTRRVNHRLSTLLAPAVIAAFAVTCLAWAPFACAAEDTKPAQAPAPAPAPEPTPAAAEVADPAAPAEPPKLPHIHVDRKSRVVDLDATVVLREGDWLELLACARGTKEHESIFSVAALPSHVHLALLLIGLEPGSPMIVRQEGEKWVSTPPKGPRVAITIRYKDAEGKQQEVPANQWVVNQKTGEMLSDNIWLFAGSSFETIRVPINPEKKEFIERESYAADLDGAIISLVNFGGDVLSRDTTVTDKTDEGMWGVKTQHVPPVGTKVTLRLKPVDKPKPAAQPKEGESPDKKPDDKAEQKPETKHEKKAETEAEPKPDAP